jgi:hypothetical protein
VTCSPRRPIFIAAIVCVAAAAMGLLVLFAAPDLHFRPPAGSRAGERARRAVPASARVVVPGGRAIAVGYRQSASPAPRTVVVGINVFRQAEPAGRRLTLADTGLGATKLDPASETAQALARWLGLERPPCAAFCESPALVVSAVHGDEGAVVCIGNPTAEAFNLRVRARLPAGLYRVEAASFSRAGGSSAQPATTPGSNAQPALAANSNGQPMLTVARTSPRALGGQGVVVKPWELGPGDWVAMRYADEAEAAHAARAEIWSALKTQSQGAPQFTGRIERVLGDAGFGNLRSGGSERLRRIHHSLLLLAQASAMQRNALERRSVDPDAGQRALAAMDRLAHALAETSACILGLVPQIAVDAHPQEPGAPAEGTVTVSLCNAGAASVSNVKIGMDFAAMPHGSVCDPSEVESFGSVAPGQTVRAAFHVRLPAAAMPGNRQIEGDVSYFAQGVPAHLRPRLWSW